MQMSSTHPKFAATSNFDAALTMMISISHFHYPFSIAGNYVHIPASGLERDNSTVPDFYKEDEVKYHGRKNRGVLALDFWKHSNSQ